MALTRRTPLRRGAPMKRTPIKAKRTQSKTDFHPSVRADIVRRSAGRCEAAVSQRCRVQGGHIHHILRRSQGSQFDADDGLMVCVDCHQWIHDHPAEATARGFLRRSGG